jgi:uncharacterized repeat protein (TIGR01451 family)
MRKPLGILASLLFLCATTLSWANYDDYREAEPVYVQQSEHSSSCGPAYPSTAYRPGCHPKRSFCGPRPTCPPKVARAEPYCQRQRCEPGCPQPAPRCEPVRRMNNCQPPCLPQHEECKAPVRCQHPNQNELKCLDGITVTAHNPKMCILGEQYPLEFEISACLDVCDVVVTTHLPQGVSFIRSQPEAKVDGRTVVWDIGAMRKGQTICAKVWLRCECEGELCACFCATATPVRFCSLLCAKPILSCHKCGPEEVCPGDPVNYTITVTNRGSCAAEDVVVIDNVPEGLEHSSCQRTLNFRLGTLEPCQSKKINVSFTATQRGRVCNTATVSACNAESTSCQWCTNISQTCVELTKTGAKEAQIGKNADYQIVVTNPGDKPLTEVIVTDVAPSSTSIVSAPGANINGNHAVWKLRELQPGESVSFNITLTTCTPGCFTNKVGVITCQGCSDCAEFTTLWRGRPALNMQISNTADAICIDDLTSYNINVINQGSEADENVRVVVHFPPEIEPLSANGDSTGQVDGQTVTFAPYNNLRARQSLSYRIDGRAKQSGDGRIVAELSSASISVPIVQQSSTIVN